MPTYEYKCETCGNLFEVFQSIKEDALESCPKCGKSIKRLIGGGMGIFFKGSGFYSTDNRSGSAIKEKTSETAEGSSSEKKPTSNETASKKTKENAKPAKSE